MTPALSGPRSTRSPSSTIAVSAGPRAVVVRLDPRDQRVEQVAAAVDIADRIDPLAGRNRR